MRRFALRRLTFAALGAALLAGGVAAVIANGDSGGGPPTARLEFAGAPNAHRHAHGEAGMVAGYLGIGAAQLREELASGKTLAQIANATSGKSAAGLIDAIVAARTGRIEAARAAGKIPHAAASRRLAALRARVTAQVNRRRLAARTGMLSAAAGYLGLSESQVRSELRSGRTLAQLAGSRPGKSSAGLVAALVGARRSSIQAALAASRRRQGAEEARLSSVQKRIEALVNHRFGPAR